MNVPRFCPLALLSRLLAHTCDADRFELKRPLRFRVVVLCVFTLAIRSATAQSTSSLAGTVQDPSGAIIRGAQVTVTSPEQGSSQNLPTNRDGRYTFPFLQPGQYDLRITAQGFKDYAQNGIIIQTAQGATVNVTCTLADHRRT